MSKLAVGLMSGTSVDGIDAALVKINGYGIKTQVELVQFSTIPYSEEVRAEIFRSMDPAQSSSALVCSLNFTLGRLFGKAVKRVCQEANIPLAQLDFIASHGQTIYHLPDAEGSYERSTLQIGEPAMIAYETGVLVVSNFRAMDMAAGGEGAPLVPYVDYVLYRSDLEGVALQNIGGIGNVTAIPQGGSLQDCLAFDTGPGNMIIDAVCSKLKGVPFDKGGMFAASGKVHENIAKSWLEMDFFKKAPPKSTGRELFGQPFANRIVQEYNGLPENDLIATVTYFTALSIAEAYKQYVFPKISIQHIIIGGGGSHNKTLLRFIKELMPTVKVSTQEEIGYSSDAKEAIAFAVLGNETLHMQPANIPSATGASKPVILGSLTIPPNGMKEGGAFYV